MDEPVEEVPSAAQVAAEIAELGVLVAETGWRLAGRVAEVGMVGPARVFARFAAAITEPAAVRIGEEAMSRQAQLRAPREPRLSERGAELLRRSADVRDDQEQHPAFRRILDELAPDEARILRLLSESGEQPVVDVKAGLPGAVRTVKPGLSMVAADAGCRRPERIGTYLINLERLGLATISREPVADPLRYQLLEAQPDVQEAMSAAGRFARTERKSLNLTDFGRDFCCYCLPSGEDG